MHFLKHSRGGTSASVLFFGVIIGATLYFTGFFTPRDYPAEGPRGIIAETTLSERDSLNIGHLPIQIVDTPTPTPAREVDVPTPTPPPEQQCLDNAAVLMMLDKSASMYGQQMDALKRAVKSFAANLTDTSIIGIQSFNSLERRDDIPISLYRDVRATLPAQIDAIAAGGATPTNTALSYSLNTLRDAVPQYSNRQFTYIFVTDGVPSSGTESPINPLNRNPAVSIRELGVTIYSIGIGVDGDPTAQQVINAIASSPNHVYNSPSGTDLTQIYNQITQRICN